MQELLDRIAQAVSDHDGPNASMDCYVASYLNDGKEIHEAGLSITKRDPFRTDHSVLYEGECKETAEQTRHAVASYLRGYNDMRNILLKALKQVDDLRYRPSVSQSVDTRS